MLDILKNKKTVVAIGKFDGFHIGHQKLLSTASKIAKEKNFLSLILFIGVGAHSLTDEKEREDMITNLGIDLSVDLKLDERVKNMTGEEFVSEILINDLNASHVVVGANFRFAKDRSRSADDLYQICKEKGIGCSVIDEVCAENSSGEKRVVSSSYIRELILNADMKCVSKFLSRPYNISGKVVNGKHIGSEIGIPTANLKSEGKIIPPSGVYASLCQIGDKKYLSITNIGTNPTVSDENDITIETNILSFKDDIYNEEIRVEFLEKIRDEKKFKSLGLLKLQVEKDIEYVKSRYSELNM